MTLVISRYSYPLTKNKVWKRGGAVAIYAKDHSAIKRCVGFEYSAGLVLLWVQYNVDNSGADLGGGCRGAHPPPLR